VSRRLVLVRHGQTTWNLDGRAQGHTDVPLDETGRAQAAAMAPYVARLGPVALWTSDLVRARQTAGYLEQATGLRAVPDPRLREFDVGARAGLTVEEFADRFPDEHAAWAAGHLTGGVPGAETLAAVADRVVPALREHLASLTEEQTGIVVAHGACLKVALVAMLGLPERADERLRVMDNCAWSVLEDDPGGRGLRLASYNETAHPGSHTPDFASDSPVG
jgi:glucosyl-3-phosphoglycerate phosphatase